MTQEPHSQPEPVRPEGGSAQPMSVLELREVFKHMVRQELLAGALTYSRRQHLLCYAEQIGLTPMHANLLIYDARRETPVELLDTPSAFRERLRFLRGVRWRLVLSLGASIPLAVATHLLIRHLLF